MAKLSVSSVYMLTFSLLLRNFLFENFLLVQVTIETRKKKCLLLFGNNSVKL